MASQTARVHPLVRTQNQHLGCLGNPDDYGGCLGNQNDGFVIGRNSRKVLKVLKLFCRYVICHTVFNSAGKEKQGGLAASVPG